MAVLSDIEKMAVGDPSQKSNMNIYLSDIDVKAPYLYLSSKDFHYCLLHDIIVNIMWSDNLEACQLQKEWIESLIRFSTLITQSGEELKRIKFIENQKNLIQNMIEEQPE